MSFANFLPVVMVLVPLGGAVAVLASARLGLQTVRSMALVNVLLTLALAVLLVRNYQVPPTLPQSATPEAIAQTADQALQMRVAFPWTSGLPWEAKTDSESNAAPPVEFALGVDGISLWLIVLSALLLVPAVLVSWNAITDRPAAFYALMLVLQAGMIGVFAAQDILLFYVFFEFTLIPLFFMIGIWGGADRRWAARKFFIFTLAGSVLTFLGLLFIVLAHKWLVPDAPLTFSIPTLTAGLQQAVGRSADAARFWQMASPWVFLALFAGFAIKVPLFPFHSWLPLAHVEAPTAGSVLLAGVLLKIGSYGFLRFALPLVPAGALWAFHAVAILAVIGIIYGALLALAQDDIKKLVAYSSVSHMGFCLLGLFAFNTVGLTGGLLQMLNHGLSTGALFALVGMLYERYHTRDIASYGGLARKYPRMAFCLLVVAFSSIGLPGLNGFTGEVTSLLGMFARNRLYGILSLSGIILGAWYTLWLVRRTFFGRLKEPIAEATHSVQHAVTRQGAHHATHAQSHADHHGHGELHDLGFRELVALAMLLIPIVWIGLYPQYFTRRMQPSLQPIVAILAQTESQPQLARQAAPAAPSSQATALSRPASAPISPAD